MGERYMKPDEILKILYIDAKKLFGQAKNQSLRYDEFKSDRDVKKEDIINIPDDSNMEYFIVCDFSYPDSIKQKTKHSSLCP